MGGGSSGQGGMGEGMVGSEGGEDAYHVEDKTTTTTLMLSSSCIISLLVYMLLLAR